MLRVVLREDRAVRGQSTANSKVDLCGVINEKWEAESIDVFGQTAVVVVRSYVLLLILTKYGAV